MSPTGRGAAGGAAGEDAAVKRVEVVLAEQRQVGLGQAEVGAAADRAAPGPARSSSARDLGLGEPGVDRIGDRAELHQRVQQDDVVEPGRPASSATVAPRRAPRAASRRAAAVASRSSSA